MIIWHIGPPWGLFRGPHGPSGPLKRPQGGPAWHNFMKYSHGKCFRAIWGHTETFWVMKGHFWSRRTIFGAVLGHYGAPVGLWKGPRVVQHDMKSCNIPIGSVLGPFGVMQCHFEPFWWFWAILGHFGTVLGHFGAPVGTRMAQGWSNMTYIHVIYPWEVF